MPVRSSGGDDGRAFWTTLTLGALLIPASTLVAGAVPIDLAERMGARPEAIAIGVVATAPPLALLVWIMKTRWAPISAFRESQIEFFGDIGFAFTRWRIVLLAIVAGIGEELLFRGVFQTAAEQHLPLAAAIILPNLLFGALHARSLIYALAAGCVGAYLGVVFWLSGSLVAVMIAHALYDLIALEWTRRVLQRKAIPAEV